MSQYDFLLALQPELHCRGGITKMKDKETWEEEEIITRIWTNESMKGKQFFAVRTCGLPQIEPDLMYNMTVIICFITVIRLSIITTTVITIITIIIVIMNRWSQASALSSIARSISPAWSPLLDGELGGFFDFLGWSFWWGVWLLRVLITREVFITVWCCNCSSLRSLTSYISWSVTLSPDSTSKHVLTTFKH